MRKAQKLITLILLAGFVAALLAASTAMFLGSRGPRPLGAMEAFKIERLEERLVSADPVTREGALMAAVIHGPNLTTSQAEAVIALGLDGRFPSSESVFLWQRAITDSPEVFERALARAIAERLRNSAASTIFFATGLETLQSIDDRYAAVDLRNPETAASTLQELAGAP